MNQRQRPLLLIALTAGLLGCSGNIPGQDTRHDEPAAVEAAKGAHGGRLLTDGDFVLELAIFETGVPPEFRVWTTLGGMPVRPSDVALQVTLSRLGGIKDEIDFAVQDDFLRGDTVIYEPHSFVVTIEAKHGGATHRWEYDNFEGRTQIGPEIAKAFGLETAISGPAEIDESITVYGRVVPDPEKVRVVSARFDGVIQSVSVSLGDRVRRGQPLAEVESNESLRSYKLTTPIDGVVTERTANAGEQTNGRQLFTIMDASTVWADLAVFPADRSRVKAGAHVTVRTADGGIARDGVVMHLSTLAEANQSVMARVALDNADGALVPGTHLTGEIKIAKHEVQLAVKRTGLQSFRDFTVVYALIGDEYEVRMLELGREDHEWAEVLGGLTAGTRYVTTNSYLIKADIEKSGASHDH